MPSAESNPPTPLADRIGLDLESCEEAASERALSKCSTLVDSSRVAPSFTPTIQPSNPFERRSRSNISLNQQPTIHSSSNSLHGANTFRHISSGTFGHQEIGRSVGVGCSTALMERDPNASRPKAAHASTKLRHDVDRLDYFLSHKKHHSKLGFMPEQVAKNIHDSLEILGHKGFLDVDDLDKISKENLANCVAKCSTMIVYMNDETIMSEWCMYEWEVANKLDIPIKVIIDMSSCVKREVVDVVKESKCAFLLQHQWLEYSDASRLAIVEELSRWVSDVGRKTTGTDRRGLMFDNDGALCVRDHGTAIQLFHPLFEKYMLFCGLVYNPSAWSGRVAAWTRFV